MSSPAGLQYSQADFLARWMPSSTRSGVILSPSPDLTGPSRRRSAVGSSPMLPDNSFTSDFAPLAASADSSWIGVDGFAKPTGGEVAGTDRPVNGLYSVPQRIAGGQSDSLDDRANESQDLPLMIKLEQLRKWQQHMQEQLKFQQLEEMLHLQEEQQRLLGHMNGSQHCGGEYTDSSGMFEADWDKDALHASPGYRDRVLQDTSCMKRQLSQADKQECPSEGQNHEVGRDGEEGTRNSREDEQEENDKNSHSNVQDGCNDVEWTEDNSRNQDKNHHDRPIRPGIGGQKQTFEELLEEQLRLEEQRLKSVQQKQTLGAAEAGQARPKKAFLKRGEGLSRFAKNHKASSKKTEAKKDEKTQARTVSRSNSEPAFVQRTTASSIARPPVQRKTAILNKENRLRGHESPPQGVRADNKAATTKVLSSHQRQNTKGAECVQPNTENRQTKQEHPGQEKEQNDKKVALMVQTTRNSTNNTQPKPVPKQVGLLVRSGTADGITATEENSGLSVESSEGRVTSEGGDEVLQDSFERSFQEKVQCWERDHQLESMELGEFELLEQMAEELSFSSNSSFVMKVLQMDQHHRQLQTAIGLHYRRLSSTPIKSPPKGVLQQPGNTRRNDGLVCESASVDSEACVVVTSNPRLQNQESIEDKREDKQEMSDVSSSGGSGVTKISLCFPAPSNPPYDKRSYEDEDRCRDSASDGGPENTMESDAYFSTADGSTLIEDENGQQGGVVFDDDDTWNDLENTAIGTADESKEESPVFKPTVGGISPPERTVLRKVTESRVVEQDKGLEPVPPSASQLMTRLFPALKPKAQNALLPPAPAAFTAPESKKPEDDTGQQVQSRLRQRLAELEIEIERFKKENAALGKLRQENEKMQETLRKECLAFEQRKAEEMAKFEEYKKEENRKLQKERKLFEKHASAARAIPDKKEREEIQMLKQQLSSVQEELRRRESRWSSTQTRLRQQIDSLSQENGSLRDEIRVLEKLRLSAWKNNSASAEKETRKKDVPRTTENKNNNVPTATKGVTFASPLDSRGSSSSSPPQSSTAAATRRMSKDNSQSAAAVMKSSLRKPAGPGSFSSIPLPSRRTEDRCPHAGKSQEKSAQQQHLHHSSPKRDPPPKEAALTEVEEPEPALEVLTHPDGKTEKVLASGDRVIIFPNGTRKEVSADGLSVRVTFFNGDTKQITADQRVVYYYADAQTTHITYPDGMEVLHFPNKQTEGYQQFCPRVYFDYMPEKHFPDGRKEITFPDQTVKNLFPNGREESVLTDGTIIQVDPDGTKEIHFNTGQKEIHTADYKRREYPDGTVKTVYTDGRQETRYPNGRLRFKDKDGNVILDNKT
ncbi:centrosomal P4.1-associated protein isoform 2-T2 [Pholidichthys leucotaenia]